MLDQLQCSVVSGIQLTVVLKSFKSQIKPRAPKHVRADKTRTLTYCFLGRCPHLGHNGCSYYPTPSK